MKHNFLKYIVRIFALNANHLSSNEIDDSDSIKQPLFPASVPASPHPFTPRKAPPMPLAAHEGAPFLLLMHGGLDKPPFLTNPRRGEGREAQEG